MNFQFILGGSQFSFDTNHPLDISIPITNEERQLSAFHLSKSNIDPVKVGSFVGDTRQGGSVNCEYVTFCPHGNGTHTECIGHITKDRVSVLDVLKGKGTFLPALLITVSPEPISSSGDLYDTPHEDNELIVSLQAVKKAINNVRTQSALHEKLLKDESIRTWLKAVVIRTLPNPIEKRQNQWSGNNPVYVTPATTDYLGNTIGIEHLLVDLPSVDRENDEGKLLSHRKFWQYESNTTTTENLSKKTITELCYIEEHIKDDIYLLDLQVSPLHLDAAPSRPLLFPIQHRE